MVKKTSVEIIRARSAATAPILHILAQSMTQRLPEIFFSLHHFRLSFSVSAIWRFLDVRDADPSTLVYTSHCLAFSVHAVPPAPGRLFHRKTGTISALPLCKQHWECFKEKVNSVGTWRNIWWPWMIRSYDELLVWWWIENKGFSVLINNGCCESTRGTKSIRSYKWCINKT